jgi:hypothetical protein
MRLLVALSAAGLALSAAVVPAAPAAAHGDRERLQQVRQDLLAEGEGTPLLSGNVQHLRNEPGTAGISGCFMKTEPLFVTSGLESVRVWDVSDGTNPTQVGVLDNAVFENEAMNCGERRTRHGRKRFALVGIDLHQASSGDIQHVNVGGQELMIVDVTDPENPTIKARVASKTSTHTVACLDETDCRYAYSAGDSGSGTFSIFDLRNLAKPREVDSNRDKAGVQPFRSPTAPGSAPTPGSTARRCGTSPGRATRVCSPPPGRPGAPATRPAGTATTTSSTTTRSGPTPRSSSPAAHRRSPTATSCW